jgi:hypothetical protein
VLRFELETLFLRLNSVPRPETPANFCLGILKRQYSAMQPDEVQPDDPDDPFYLRLSQRLFLDLLAYTRHPWASLKRIL